MLELRPKKNKRDSEAAVGVHAKSEILWGVGGEGERAARVKCGEWRVELRIALLQNDFRYFILFHINSAAEERLKNRADE